MLRGSLGFVGFIGFAGFIGFVGFLRFVEFVGFRFRVASILYKPETQSPELHTTVCRALGLVGSGGGAGGSCRLASFLKGTHSLL